MPLKTHIDEQPTLNLTPMIDVLFLIIIFFLVGTKIADAEKDINIDLPKVTAGAEPLTATPQPRVVNVLRDGTVMLGDQAVTLEELQKQLAQDKQEYEELGVEIRGDGSGTFQPIVTVLQTVRNAGIDEMSIAVKEEGGE